MTQRGEAIPRYRAYQGPALLAQGFRPFFLAAGLWAVLGLVLWLGWLHGGWRLPLALPGVIWHGHEMLFGYLVAALAGFLLTAVPNWTGRMPLQGTGLASLAALWLLGRLAMAVGGGWPPALVAACDLAFPVALLAVIAREILAGRNWRNLPVLGGLTMLTAAEALVLLSAWIAVDPRLGLRLAAATFVVLIALIGGRIVPSFTRNWLVKQGHTRVPASFGHGDRVCLFVTAVAAIAWTLAPTAAITAVVAAAAALVNVWRLARWRGAATWREPLLVILHVGYAWLPAGFALVAAAGTLSAVPATAALHAFTAGAMGTMPIAVMTRAILGHTGRPLRADVATVVAYVLVLAAAVLRIVAAVLPAQAMALLGAAGAAWIAGFAVFLLAYGPKLCRPRQ